MSLYIRALKVKPLRETNELRKASRSGSGSISKNINRSKRRTRWLKKMMKKEYIRQQLINLVSNQKAVSCL